MHIDMEMFGISEFARKLWNLEDYPHAELYYELAYEALLEGDVQTATAYFSKTMKALEKGNALTVLNGQKAPGQSYSSRKRAHLKVIP